MGTIIYNRRLGHKSAGVSGSLLVSLGLSVHLLALGKCLISHTSPGMSCSKNRLEFILLCACNCLNGNRKCMANRNKDRSCNVLILYFAYL